jgi:poly(A) polymerase
VIPDRLRPVLDRTAPLAERFAASGHRLYLVGGVVRDLLLGLDMSAGRDIDLTTDARPEQTKALLKGWAESMWTQGERFGTIGCRRDGWDFEITTHRAEAYDPDSRKPAVEFAPPCHPRSRSPTTRCGCCEPPASSPVTASNRCPSSSPRWRP